MAHARFQPRLESLRGVAALMVAYYHALAAVRIEDWWPAKIKSVLQMAGTGSGGVAIFFVLSGYVLGQSLNTSSTRLGPEAIRFAVRRALRIWPAMAVCLVICFVAVRFLYVPQTFAAASTDYYNLWQDGATGGHLLMDLLFLDAYYNPVTWTLEVEMIAALVFVLLWWIRRRSAAASLLLTTAWAAWFLSTPRPGGAGPSFLYMLTLGLHAGAAARFAARHLSGRALKIAVALSFLGLGAAFRYQWSTEAVTWFVQSLFAFAIVSLLIASHGVVSVPLLDHPAARFMGRISYSFYLWHLLVLYIIETIVFRTVDPNLLLSWPNSTAGVLLIVSVAAVIPVAWASYQFIELPGIRIARSRTGS